MIDAATKRFLGGAVPLLAVGLAAITAAGKHGGFDHACEVPG